MTDAQIVPQVSFTLSFAARRFLILVIIRLSLSRIDIGIDTLFYLDNTLSHGYGASHRLDKQSLHDAPARLQERQENKITK